MASRPTRQDPKSMKGQSDAPVQNKQTNTLKTDSSATGKLNILNNYYVTVNLNKILKKYC